VQCWGYNDYGQVSPVSDGEFAQVSAGLFHTCAVRRDDGSIECWGDDSYGQASPPGGGRQMLQITDSTQGDSFNVATSGNGQVVAFLSSADLVPWENDDGSVELFVARLDPAPLQIVQVTHTTSGVSISHPSISHDGSRIAFLYDGNLVVAEFDPDELSVSPTPIQITNAGPDITNAEPALSGDGKTIAFISDGELDPERDNTTERNPELYLATVDSPGTFIQVTLTGQDVTNAAPSINHLGTQVAFVSDGNLRPSPGNPEGNQEVLVASCHLPPPETQLEVVKKGPISVWYGGTFPYTLTVTNEGQTPAFGVTVVDQLDGSATLYPGDPRCVEQGQYEVTCYASELDPGETMTLTVWARVESSKGQLVNAVDAWAINAPVYVADPFPIQIGPAADLSVEKSTSAQWAASGETITYTILVENSLYGTTTGVTVTDTVTASVPYIEGAATLPGGNCEPWQGGTVTCTTSSLAAGEIATLTLAITPLQSGVITNTVWVTSTETYSDPDPTNNKAHVILGPPPIYLPLILRGG
jgi:uncharacterized repeat protein (TIGR01451 family)